MTNKSATNLRYVGIIATIVLVSAIFLKFSSKDDNINIVSVPASAAAARTSGGGMNWYSTSSASVVVLSSLERLLQDEVNISGAEEAEIFCAKNEYESFQIIIVNPTNKPISQINLKADNWHFTGTPGEESPELTLYHEHYVKVDRPSYKLKSKLGMYPDALIPFIDPYTGKEIVNAKYLARNQDVGPHKNQGYWIDVHVGSNVKAGIYTNEIDVLASGQIIKRIPVKLTVWDFTLPAKHSLATWFGGLYNLSNAYGLKYNSKEYTEMIHRHQKFLFEHGIYPPILKHPQINSATGEVTFTPEYTAFLRTFVGEYGAQTLNIPTLFIKQPEKLAKYVAAYDAFSHTNPWAGQYFYLIDEPETREAFQTVKQCGDIIHTYAPSVKFLLTYVKIPRTEWPDIEDVADIKVVVFRLASATNLQTLKQGNKEMWGYTAMTNIPLNWELDSELMNYRIPTWCSYVLGIKGIMYWRTMAWAGAEGTNEVPFDPWLTLVWTNKQGFIYNGEGSLIYSGTQAGIQGPVASMRLKVFRDSVEDYEYLKLFESLSGEKKAVSAASAVATDFRNYDSNPDAYITQRKAIAEKILSGLKK